MTVSVTVTGLKELQATLSKLPAKLQERAGNRSVSAAAKIIQDEVKARAPIREVPAGTAPGKRVTAGKPKLRFPGNLRRRVVRRKVSKRGDSQIRYVVRFAQAAWYGRLVEMGTKTAAPHPFMRPAIDAKGSAAIDKFRVELSGQIDASVKASQ
jgi:HK97 gp10 family phage protein